MANRGGRKRGAKGTAPANGDAGPTGGGGGAEDPGWEPADVAAVELIAELARLDLEAALACDAAAALCSDDDLRSHLRVFARDHRVHVAALNEALEAEGETAVVAPAPPGGPVFAGLVRVTGPLGDEGVVVTLLGTEQLTNLSHDAALAYEWDPETEAMLRRFQEDEERHLAWLAAKHDALGAEQPDQPAS